MKHSHPQSSLAPHDEPTSENIRTDIVHPASQETKQPRSPSISAAGYEPLYKRIRIITAIATSKTPKSTALLASNSSYLGRVSAPTVVHNAARSTSPPGRICILSLDGGGVRGLSSLLILRELMAQLQASRRAAGTVSTTSELLRPCDEFDLIVGTGTGGISALLLGRMHLSVHEAIDEYIHMARMIRSRLFLPLSRRLLKTFHKETLESHLRTTVKK
jgi:hypothetical protein